MIKERVSFKADGLELVGEIFQPGTAGPYPGICICHGIPAEKPAATTPIKDRGYAELAERICGEGFLTLVFNFRGTGASQGSFDILGWTQDLKAALDYVYEQPALNRKSLSLLGFSAGAATVICVAAEDDRVTSVVSAAAPADFEGLLNEAGPEAVITRYREIGIIRDEYPISREEWLDGFRKVKPVERVADISPRPLLVMHGSDDDVVPVSHGRELYRTAGSPKDIVIIKGLGHRLRQDEGAMLTAAIWLKRQARRSCQ